MIIVTINVVPSFAAGIPQQPPMIPHQQQPFISSSHTSSSRGIDQDEMMNRDQPLYDGHDQYPRGRVPSAVPDNRSYRPQYDPPRETESPNVSVRLPLWFVVFNC